MSVLASVEERNDTAVMALAGSAHFSSHLMQLALPPLFPILNVEFGVGFTRLGLIVTLFYIASGLGQAAAGVLVDRYGAHRLLIGGLTAMSAAIGLSGLAPGYWALLPLAVIAGLGNSVFHPADLSILSHCVSAQRLGRAYAVHGIAGGFGFATSAALIVGVTAFAGWRVALLVVGAIGLTVAAVLFANRARLVYVPRQAARASSASHPLAAYLAIVASPVVLLGFAYFALTALAGTGVQTFAISALTEGYGLPLGTATLGLTIYLVGSLCGMVFGGILADRTDNHHRVAMTGIVIVAALMLVIGILPGLGLVVLPVLFVAGIASGTTSPSRDVLIRRAALDVGAGTGSIFGFVYSGLDLGSSIAPLIFGILVDYHAAQAVFLVIAATFALAAPTVMQVQSSARRQRTVPAE